MIERNCVEEMLNKQVDDISWRAAVVFPPGTFPSDVIPTLFCRGRGPECLQSWIQRSPPRIHIHGLRLGSHVWRHTSGDRHASTLRIFQLLHSALGEQTYQSPPHANASLTITLIRRLQPDNHRRINWHKHAASYQTREMSCAIFLLDSDGASLGFCGGSCSLAAPWYLL